MGLSLGSCAAVLRLIFPCSLRLVAGEVRTQAYPYVAGAGAALSAIFSRGTPRCSHNLFIKLVIYSRFIHTFCDYCGCLLFSDADAWVRDGDAMPRFSKIKVAPWEIVKMGALIILILIYSLRGHSSTG